VITFDVVAPVDLLAVGEAFEDLVFFGLPRLPRPGEELEAPSFLQTVGGGAVITAIAAARCGLRCSVLSGLGEQAVRVLREDNVGVLNLRREHEAAAVTVALSTKTNRSVVTFNGVNDALEARLFKALPRLAAARHVHFAFHPRDCRAWTTVVLRLRGRGLTSSWDFGWKPSLREDRRFGGLIAALDYVFFNLEEAAFYARRVSLDGSARYWRVHARNAIIKLGAQGCRWVSADRDLLAPGVRVRIVDTTGAGDAFNGGFLYALLKKMSPEACLRFANTVGALSTRAPGGIAGLPRRREVR
jgi:sugar/nucleoside kinase (ribokinase family)